VSPLPIVFEDLPPNKDGLCDFGNKISIRNGMSEIQTASAVIHEITHAKLHALVADGGEPKDRRTEEVEAESISFVVNSHFSIDTGANSFGYIATWSKTRELKELNASLDLIRKTATELIDGIDEKYRALAKERGIDLSVVTDELGAEQNYNMIDGVINNEPPKKEETPAPDYDVMNDRDEMIRRIIEDTLKHDPEFPDKALKGMEDDYRSASIEGLREAYLFYFPNDTPAVEKETAPATPDIPPAPETAPPQPNEPPAPDILAAYARSAAVRDPRQEGLTILMPLLFEDGNLNRDNKRSRVKVEPPIGKYEIFSRDEGSMPATNYLYMMTVSGKLISLGASERLKDLTEARLDEHILALAGRFDS
jgi:hypothetical protein